MLTVILVCVIIIFVGCKFGNRNISQNSGDILNDISGERKK